MKLPFAAILSLLPLTVPMLEQASGCGEGVTPTPTQPPDPTDPSPTAEEPTPGLTGERPESTLKQLSALRFDAHTHPYDRAQGSIIYDEGESLASVVAENNLAGVMASVKMGTFNETDNGEAMRYVSSRYPFVVPLLWIHPSTGGDAETAERYLRDHQFAGLKVHPAIESLPADSPLLDPYLELAVRYGVPVVIHTASDDPSWPDRVGALAERHPDAEIVLYHSGLSTDHIAAIGVVESHPNTWLETSWVETADVQEVIEVLGSERVLFGTDATVDGAVHYEHNWGSGSGNGSYDAQLIALGLALPRSTYRDLLVQNAARVFNLVTIHTYRPGAAEVSMRFDNGTGVLGDVWPMMREGENWWRRVVPARGSVRFQVLVDGLDVDGGVSETDAWEVWQQDGVLQTSLPETTIQVVYDAGYGHGIFIRGEDWPLSWSVGEPMTWTAGNVWTLTLRGIVEPLSFKALIDDSRWEQGANHSLAPGQTVQISPTF